MKIEDPKTKKMVEGVRRIYTLKMKAGTTGTMDNPHRPEIADLLQGKAHDWSVNPEDQTIRIDCEIENHRTIEETHTRIDG